MLVLVLSGSGAASRSKSRVCKGGNGCGLWSASLAASTKGTASCSLRLASWRWRPQGHACIRTSTHPEAPGTSNRTPSCRSCSSPLFPTWCSRCLARTGARGLFRKWLRVWCHDWQRNRSLLSGHAYAVGTSSAHIVGPPLPLLVSLRGILVPRSAHLTHPAACIHAEHPEGYPLACARCPKQPPSSRCAGCHGLFHTCVHP